MSGYDAELAQLTEESSDCSETQAPVRRTLTLRKAAGLAVVGILGLAALRHATSGNAGALSYKAAAVVDLAEEETLLSQVVAQEAEVQNEEAALEEDIKKAELAIREETTKIAEDMKDPKKLAKDLDDLGKKMKELQELTDALLKEFAVHMQLESMQELKAVESDKKAGAAAEKKAEADKEKFIEDMKKMMASAKEPQELRASVAKKLAEDMKDNAAANGIVAAEKKASAADQIAQAKTMKSYAKMAMKIGQAITMKAYADDEKAMRAKFAKATADSKKISAAEKMIVGPGDTANISGDQKIKTLVSGVGSTVNLN
ncbi:unnamed protein product [Polarella glacialis]|nr:unnamed protein product [Polarella glacialis]